MAVAASRSSSRTPTARSTKVRETGGEFERILAQQPNANFFFNGENTFGTLRHALRQQGPGARGRRYRRDQRPHLCVRGAGARRRRHDLRRHRSGQRDLRRLQAAAAADGTALAGQCAGDHQVHQRGRQPDRHARSSSPRTRSATPPTVYAVGRRRSTRSRGPATRRRLTGQTRLDHRRRDRHRHATASTSRTRTATAMPRPPTASSCSPARRRPSSVGQNVMVTGTVAEFVPEIRAPRRRICRSPRSPARPSLCSASARRSRRWRSAAPAISCRRPATCSDGVRLLGGARGHAGHR